MLLSHLPLLGLTFQRPHVTSVKPGRHSKPYYKGETLNIYLNVESLVVLPRTHLKLRFHSVNAKSE